ncbi:MAG: hypothetical protein HY939_03925 [Gammaproteobacteria bacterium]|nr:hypothetical protein [Gammaproteobacteria bacterium]
MKHALNFRLNEQTVVSLSILQKKLHCSKTAIIERAVQAYVKQVLPRQQKLLAFSGVLNEHDANSMLELIDASKNNKEMDFDL